MKKRKEELKRLLEFMEDNHGIPYAEVEEEFLELYADAITQIFPPKVMLRYANRTSRYLFVFNLLVINLSPSQLEAEMELDEVIRIIMDYAENPSKKNRKRFMKIIDPETVYNNFEVLMSATLSMIHEIYKEKVDEEKAPCIYPK